MIIKDGDIITADQARAIIKTYGADKIIFDGNLPVDFYIEDIEDKDNFTVIINYGNNVRLIFKDDNGWADICINNLFGQCNELIENDVLTIAQWHAVVEI